jgi:hypothetical protein
MLFQFNLEFIKHGTQDMTPQHLKDVTCIVNPKVCFQILKKVTHVKESFKKNPLNLAKKFP